MKTRASQDPTSWDFQACIHGYAPDLVQLNPPPPSSADQKTFWNQCQHGTWYFLSWHRAYLYYFESIVMQTIQSLGGPDDWALPYWNYSESLEEVPQAQQLPPEFIQQTLPGSNTPNPLFEQNRDRGNDGENVPTNPADVDLTTALQISPFAGVRGGDPGFGGMPTSFPHHIQGDTEGRLELQPHDVIHGDIGGLMGDPRTAALDPIFWLHHSNIDRLWVVWLNGYGGQKPTDPSQSSWLSQGFTFRDATGATVSINASQILDPSAAPLDYQYEDTQNPLDGQVAPAPQPQPEVESLAMTQGQTPETVGATQSEHVLSLQPTTADIPLSAPSGPARLAAVAPGAEPTRRVYVHFENVTAGGRTSPYEVYLNLPAGADPRQNQDHYLGVLPMFGVTEASIASDQHPGSGRTFTLDATKVIVKLKARGAWNDNNVQITLVPRYPDRTPEPIKIGRISITYA
ncbi:MAG: tyrosinase family protein [Chloroflexi bacterium]|nr:tyrosinase family protein [Chloroflexota bacterium]